MRGLYNMQGKEEMMSNFYTEMAKEISIDWSAVIQDLTTKVGQLNQEVSIRDNIIKQLSQQVEELEEQINVGDKPKSKK